MDDKKLEQKLHNSFSKKYDKDDVLWFYISSNKKLRFEIGQKDSYIAELEDKVSNLENFVNEITAGNFGLVNATKLETKLENQKIQINALNKKYSLLKKTYSTLLNKNSILQNNLNNLKNSMQCETQDMM